MKLAACVSFLKFSRKDPSLLNVFLKMGAVVDWISTATRWHDVQLLT